MRLRVARKVLKAVFRYTARHKRDTIRRAALRAWASPLQITMTAGNLIPSAPLIGRVLRGRCVVISPKLGVFEQPRRLFDVKRDHENERLRLVPRG